MNEELFRKKSLDKVKSPENLDDYIQVSNPGVWLLLVSVIVLLAGTCIWGIFGHIDSTADIVVSAEKGVITGTVTDLEVEVGMTVRVADTECEICGVEYNSESGRLICTVTAEADVPDGVYDAEIVTESYKPLSFILN